MSGLAPIRAGVIGWPITHSLSPLLHNYWLKELDIDGDYQAIGVPPDILNVFLQELPASGLVGVNVTIPHKQSVMPHVTPDNTAQATGAVNTILVKDGALLGFNSDVAGFLGPLEVRADLVHLRGGACVVAGTGGAARAIVYALKSLGCSEIRILCRNADKGRALLKSFALDQNEVYGFDQTSALNDAVLLVNATSLGMVGQAPLRLDLEKLDDQAIVYDIVYTPIDTPLLRDAQAQGLMTIDGLGMLIGQAKIAFTRFFGRHFEGDLGVRDSLLNRLSGP